ncbi:cytochrome c oxidase subunit 2A [Gracilibacillus dipsosauri]|uniref:Cytochrome c oxidase subunit 2A n=1 Tax=Gracilibacillus dipsosauri TaxID=178340 RepID=A0A317L1Y7_9BACI|nr:cytochrome c oxidase subunit 2A [Gracilibacillus dipsosauri]
MKLNKKKEANTVGKQVENNKEASLKGAFVSVLFLGSFIALLWLGIWSLFMARV